MPTSERVDQFVLARLQVINWGVFDGYHSVPFSPGGSLITGASGSGKSSLLDAISLGFLPFNRRNFNASGDHSAAGASAGRRTVDKYVRGAWGERSNGNGSEVMFLRGTGPVFSAVAVTYRSTSGRQVTGLVLKWFSGETRTEASSRYCLADGDRDIRELCNRWSAGGRYDSAVFRADGWRSTKVEQQYLAQLYAAIGIRASDAAQQLLGKAKSLKSVGGLEQFVRDFMLDEPQSLARVADALKQIDPLVEARELLAVAQHKRRILGDIEMLQERYVRDSTDLGVIDIIDMPMVRSYVDAARLQRCPAAIADLDATIGQLDAESDELVHQRNLVKAEHDSLMAQAADANSSIAPLAAQLENAEARAAEVTRRRATYDELVFGLDFAPAQSAETFWQLRSQFGEQVNRTAATIKQGEREYTEAAALLSQARADRDALAAELDRVQRRGSTIPALADQMRARICEAVGVPAARMPYVAELLDLHAGEQRWRVAVERILASAGLRLLVPTEHHEAVLRFVNDNPMGGRIQIQRADTGAAVQHPPEQTLAAKLYVVDATHPCAGEAMSVITSSGDYICVDGPQFFPRYRRAVTDQGLRKDSDRVAVKDDRAPLRASQYLFQGSIDAKIDALRVELDDAEAAYTDASERIDALQRNRDGLAGTARIAQKIYDQFTQWSEIDTETADNHVDRLREQYENLLSANPDVEVLTDRAQRCWSRIEALMKQIGSTETAQREADDQRTRLLELTERLEPQPVGEHARRLLAEHAAALGAGLELLNPEPYRDALHTVIRREREVLRDSRKRSRAELERILAAFDAEFSDAIPNDGDDFDERVHDYAGLCRHIDERELPAAYEQMMRLITEQAPDAILTLHRVAEQEARRITEQIARVNTGLGAVEFNRGTRLTLRATERSQPAVAQLREMVSAISGRIAAVSLGDSTAIVEQYADILTLRNRLAGSAPEDRAWTQDALDVRNRFTFDCAETDALTQDLIRTHSNAGDNSGGEQEKLMAFCLAGALSYNLADPEKSSTQPIFAQLMLDEAFSKSDPQFAQQALHAFSKFGFQLIIVATVQNTTTIEPFVDSVVMVSKSEAASRLARPVAAVTARSIGDFADMRRHRGTAPMAGAGQA